MKAIEAPLETPDRLDLKAQNLSLLLGPISRVNPTCRRSLALINFVFVSVCHSRQSL